MKAQEKFFTVEDLLAMPDNGRRYELVDGELIDMALPSRAHALLSSKALRCLGNYAEVNDLGQVTGSDGGFLLHTDPKTGKQTMRVPDVAFVKKNRELVTLDSVYVGAPDLAVEVISPSETHSSIQAKLKHYFAYGTQLVWLIYPEARAIEVYRSADPAEAALLTEKDMLDGSELLPGFSLKIQDLFSVLGR